MPLLIACLCLCGLAAAQEVVPAQSTLRSDLVHLSGVFDQQYHQTVRMIDAEHQRSQHFLSAEANQTLHNAADFAARLRAGLARAAARVQHIANRTCTGPLAAERARLHDGALHAQRACLRAIGQQLQRNRRSTFYQLTRLMQRESMASKSLVLAVLGQYNVCGERERAQIGPTLRWTAEWTAGMWPASAANVRVERELTVRQTMRADAAMRACELQAAGEFGRRVEANVRRALQC